MFKWIEYLQIGAKVFAGIQLLLAGQNATFSFTYKGKNYDLNIQLTPEQLLARAALAKQQVAPTRAKPGSGDPGDPLMQIVP